MMLMVLRMLTGVWAFLASVLRPVPASLAAALARMRVNSRARALAAGAAAHGPRNYDKEAKPRLRNGWYSPSVASRPHKTVTYRNPTTGQEVTITEISSKPTACHRPPDLLFVGEVDASQWVRGGIR